MGYREDIALAISADGWNYFQDALNLLTGSDRDAIEQLVGGADQHWEHPNGHHLLMWDCIKTTATDFQTMDAVFNHYVPQTEWIMRSIGEDGAENTYGEWWDDAFGSCITRSFYTETDGCARVIGMKQSQPGDMLGFPKPAVAIPADDHTCIQCQNPKCSKTEKSCWKCGYPIS